MAGEEATEGSRRRRRMDLNLYMDLPPLPRPRVRLVTSVASSPTLMMPNSTGAAPEAPRTSEPMESLAPAVVGEPKKDGSCGCNSSFECNICLDMAKDPVVTHCGHLFYWPCLYRWIYPQSPFCECPVCKGEVLEGSITPIYGRGNQEGDSTINPDLPPRPRANRRESLMQQLQMSGDTREIVSVIRQLIRNPDIVSGLPTLVGTEMTLVPAARQSANAAQVVLAAPQQSSSVEQLSTSSTASAIVGGPGPSRRSRRTSESPTIRTRRPH